MGSSVSLQTVPHKKDCPNSAFDNKFRLSASAAKYKLTTAYFFTAPKSVDSDDQAGIRGDKKNDKITENELKTTIRKKILAKNQELGIGEFFLESNKITQEPSKLIKRKNSAKESQMEACWAKIINNSLTNTKISQHHERIISNNQIRVKHNILSFLKTGKNQKRELETSNEMASYYNEELKEGLKRKGSLIVLPSISNKKSCLEESEYDMQFSILTPMNRLLSASTNVLAIPLVSQLPSEKNSEKFITMMKKGAEPPMKYRWLAWKASVRLSKFSPSWQYYQSREKPSSETNNMTSSKPPETVRQASLPLDLHEAPQEEGCFMDSRISLTSENDLKEQSKSGKSLKSIPLGMDTAATTPRNSAYVCILTSNKHLSIPRNYELDIKKDLHRTYPSEKYFANEVSKQEGQEQLFNVLKLVCYKFPKIGYCQGMNFLMGFLLIVSGGNEIESVMLFESLALNPRFHILGLFEKEFALVYFLVYVFFKVLRQEIPDLFHKFKEISLPDHSWVAQWFMTFYLYLFPLKDCLRIWDFIFSGNIFSLIKIAIAFLQINRRNLKEMDDPCEIIKYFKSYKFSYDDSNGTDQFELKNEIDCEKLLSKAKKVTISAKRVGKYCSCFIEENPNFEQNIFVEFYKNYSDGGPEEKEKKVAEFSNLIKENYYNDNLC